MTVTVVKTTPAYKALRVTAETTHQELSEVFGGDVSIGPAIDARFVMLNWIMNNDCKGRYIHKVRLGSWIVVGADGFPFNYSDSEFNQKFTTYPRGQ